MASRRKSSSSRSKPRSAARSKSSRPRAKTARRPKAKAAKPAARRGKASKPVSHKATARPAAASPARGKLVPVRPDPKKPARPGARPAAAARPGQPALKAVPVGKGVPGGKAGDARRGNAREPRPAPEVRPLGVLPPESMVRAREKHAAPAVEIHRPSGSRPLRTVSDTKGVQAVTEQDYPHFEQRLRSEREKILKEMGHLESTVLKVNPRDSAGDLSGYSFHMADAGTDAMEREKAFLFASAEGRLLMEINEALRRMYRGEYGACERCGNPIARPRLEALPQARLCLACQEKEERASKGAQ